MNDLLHAFPGQNIDEPVFVFARPYFVAFIPTALLFLVVFVFSLFSQFLLANNLFNLSVTADNAGILLLGAFELFTLIVFFVAVLDFYYDIVIVTDRRAVDIDQEQLFFRRITELSLEEVEDVTSTVQGFFRTIFNFGTVQIETAGKDEMFTMANVRFPREITAIVLDLSAQAKKETPENSRYPQTKVLAVINNQAITNTATLQSLGAILPSDFRLVQRNAPQ